MKFQCYIVEEPEECDSLPNKEPTFQEAILDTLEAEAPPSISFNGMQGNQDPTTLRLEGVVNGNLLAILIDSGSTHNFLQSRVAKFAG